MNSSVNSRRSAPFARRIGARLARLGKVAGDIADRRIQLGDGDADAWQWSGARS